MKYFQFWRHTRIEYTMYSSTSTELYERGQVVQKRRISNKIDQKTCVTTATGSSRSSTIGRSEQWIELKLYNVLFSSCRFCFELSPAFGSQCNSNYDTLCVPSRRSTIFRIHVVASPVPSVTMILIFRLHVVCYFSRQCVECFVIFFWLIGESITDAKDLHSRRGQKLVHKGDRKFLICFELWRKYRQHRK